MNVNKIDIFNNLSDSFSKKLIPLYVQKGLEYLKKVSND